jgi:hypothetical protein
VTIPHDFENLKRRESRPGDVDFVPVGQVDTKTREFDFSQPNQMFFLPSVLDKHRFKNKHPKFIVDELQDMALFFDRDQKRPLIPKTNGVFYMAFDRENGHVFGNPIATNLLVKINQKNNCLE